MFRTLDGCIFPAEVVNWGITKLYKKKVEGIIEIPFKYFDEIDRLLLNDFVKAPPEESIYMFTNKLSKVVKNIERIPLDVFTKYVKYIGQDKAFWDQIRDLFKDIPFGYH